MQRKKVSVIGSGNVGGTLAQFLAIKEIGDVYFFDIVDSIPKGKALDIFEGAPHWGYDIQIEGYTVEKEDSYRNLEGSDLIIVTSGLGRKPGMSRDDLLEANFRVIKTVGENIRRYSNNSIIIVVTNPADAMAYAMQKVTGMPHSNIVGLGGSLDSARFKSFIAHEVGVSVNDVTAMVIGGHGDDMVPFIRYTSIAGIPLTQFLDDKKIEEIVNRTRNGGTEIVNLYKTGGAYYAPAASILSMAESILKDKKRVISCAAYLSKESGHGYGVNDIFIGVPIVIGSNGVEKILNIDFTDKERILWDKTVRSVRKNCAKIDTFLAP